MEAEQTLKRLIKNRRGLIQYIAVAVLALFFVGMLSFFFMVSIQSVQTGMNTQLASNNWIDNSVWEIFNGVNTFINYFWVGFVVFLVLGLAYYGYNQAQRRRYY